MKTHLALKQHGALFSLLAVLAVVGVAAMLRAGGDSSSGAVRDGLASGPGVESRNAASPNPAAPASTQVNLEWREISPPQVSKDFNSPPDNFGFQIIVADPLTSGRVFVGTNYQGLWRSTDSGDTWSRADRKGVNGVTFSGRLWCLAADPFHADTLYACDGYGSAGLFKSTDAGETWKQVLSQDFMGKESGDVYHVSVDPYQADHLLVAFHGGWSLGSADSGILESKDGGASWRTHKPQGPWSSGNNIFFLGDSNSWLLTTQNAGIWKTSNAGASWRKVSSENMMHGANMLYHASNGAWYTGAVATVLRSGDDGDTWSRVNVPHNQDGYNAVIGDGTRLYAQSTNTGRSTIGPGSYVTSPETDGVNWTKLNDQTFIAGPMSMAYDPANHLLFSSNWNAGVFRLSTAGQ